MPKNLHKEFAQRLHFGVCRWQMMLEMKAAKTTVVNHVWVIDDKDVTATDERTDSYFWWRRYMFEGFHVFTFIDDLFQTENQIIKSDELVKTTIYYLFGAVILIYHF